MTALALDPGERDRFRGRLLRLAGDLYPVHRLDAQEAVPVCGTDQSRETGAPGAHGAFMLKREEHPLVLRLLAGEHRGVLAAADRDVAGCVGGAGECEQGPQPYPAPALIESAPALAAVEVSDQFGVHQRAQVIQGEASGPLDVAANRKRDVASHQTRFYGRLWPWPLSVGSIFMGIDRASAAAELTARARELWEYLAGAAGFTPGLRVAASPQSYLCPPGWVGIVVLGDEVIATAPDPET